MKLDAKLNCVYISQYFSPDITAAAFRVEETVSLLRQAGHNVEVVTAVPHKAQITRASCFPTKSEDGIYRMPLIKYKGGGKLNYIVHYISFMITAIIGGLFKPKGRIDVIIASSPPLFAGIAGAVVAILRRVPLVLDIRDIWPDSAVSAGQISKSGSMFRLGKIVEQWLYNKADLITCVAQPMAEYIKGYVPDKKITVIYNGVPENYLTDNAVSDNAGIKFQTEKVNIVYVGNMGYCQALDLVLEAAYALKQKGDRHFHFYMIGSGVEKEKLAARREELSLDNVTIAGPVSKDHALSYIRQASALFLQLIDDGTMSKTIPSKVFDYMTAGKPILFGIEGEGKEILSRVSGNLLFSANDIGSFTDALNNLASRQNELTKHAEQNRQIVLKGFTREVMVEKLENDLINLMNLSKRPGIWPFR